MKFGARAHDFGTGTITDIAKTLEQYHVECVQLALSKSFPILEDKPNQLNASIAREVRETFAKHRISIGVLGCYINPIHPDPTLRELSIQRFEEHLEFAAQFNCNIVGTETGSINADCTYHPQNNDKETFSDLVSVIKRLARSAEKYKTIVGIEGVAHHHVINEHHKMVELLDAVGSEYVKVIYDPVNFYPMAQNGRQEEWMDEAFNMFGDQIVAVHCKDFLIKNNCKIGDFTSGEGEMNHQYLFQLLSKFGLDVPIILECTGQEKIENALKFVREEAQAK